MRRDFEEIADALLASCDIDIRRYDREFVTGILSRRMKSLGYDAIDQYLMELPSHPIERSELLAMLHNTYTDFYRDLVTTAVLERSILPALVERRCGSERNSVRVWSAACSSGQEAYGIAMLLHDIIAARECDCSFRVFATDRNASVLDIAIKGRYEREKLGRLRVAQLDTFFTAHTDGYEVSHSLRTHLEFSLYDLFDPDSMCPPACIYGEFDVVLCSNVLLYYNERTRQFVLEKLQRCLARNGVLVTGESEREIVTTSALFKGFMPGLPIYTANTDRR
ncbi:MAG: hypothetical protein M5R41_15705 [Bacteroidia bacterium]|nr:hypothetical protein [Bacteroidia bacterium]